MKLSRSYCVFSLKVSVFIGRCFSVEKEQDKNNKENTFQCSYGSLICFNHEDCLVLPVNGSSENIKYDANESFRSRLVKLFTQNNNYLHQLPVCFLGADRYKTDEKVSTFCGAYVTPHSVNS